MEQQERWVGQRGGEARQRAGCVPHGAARSCRCSTLATACSGPGCPGIHACNGQLTSGCTLGTSGTPVLPSHPCPSAHHSWHSSAPTVLLHVPVRQGMQSEEPAQRGRVQAGRPGGGWWDGAGRSRPGAASRAQHAGGSNAMLACRARQAGRSTLCQLPLPHQRARRCRQGIVRSPLQSWRTGRRGMPCSHSRRRRCLRAGGPGAGGTASRRFGGAAPRRQGSCRTLRQRFHLDGSRGRVGSARAVNTRGVLPVAACAAGVPLCRPPISTVRWQDGRAQLTCRAEAADLESDIQGIKLVCVRHHKHAVRVARAAGVEAVGVQDVGEDPPLCVRHSQQTTRHAPPAARTGSSRRARRQPGYGRAPRTTRHRQRGSRCRASAEPRAGRCRR